MNPVLIEFLESADKHRSVEAMATKTLPSVVSHIGAENGSLMLLSGERVIHKVLANKETFSQVSEHKLRTVLTEGLAGWALRHRQGALASDTTLDERWAAMGDTSIGSALAVPMICRGRVSGLLSLHHSERGYLRESHLAQAAALATALALPFEIALMKESTMAALIAQCRCASYPSVVLDVEGNVKATNTPMQALDIAWEGAHYSQTLLPRELNAASIDLCDWEGSRNLSNLPFEAQVISFRGAGIWIQMVKNRSPS
jgi:hypothetical protein